MNQTSYPVETLGSLADTWKELREKYNDTFNPEGSGVAPAPTGTVTAAPPAESKFLGIPSTWLLYGGLGAIGVAAVVVLAKGKKTSGRSKKK